MVVGSTPWAGRRGPARRSLADPWDRVASRSSQPGRSARRTNVSVTGPRAGASHPPRRAWQAQRRRSSWLDEASANRALGVRRRASGAPATSTTRASSRCSPAPCARSRPPSSAARVKPSVRTKFQVVALLVREERARVKADETSTEAQRAEQLKRLDGVATILAKTAARDTSLLALLAEDADRLRRGQGAQAARCCGPPGIEAPPEEPEPAEPTPRRHQRASGRAAVGRLPPARQPVPRPRLLRRRAAPGPAPAGWPPGSCSARCSASFEYGGGVRRAWTCPSRPRCRRPAASS